MNYKKVLVVSNMYPNKSHPSYGVFVKNFCSQLGVMGINYRVSKLTKANNRFEKVIKYGLFYIRTFVMSLLGNFDLVYIHYPSFSAKPVLIARKMRTFDIISNVHGTDVVPLKEEHEKMQGNTRQAIENSSLVVVPSEYYKQIVVEKYKIPNKKVFIYPSAGINEKLFYPFGSEKVTELKNKHKIDGNTFVIGFVSRINKAKGWDIFLEALEKCYVLKDSKIAIYIIGSGEDDRELDKKINSLPSYIGSEIRRYPLLPQESLAELYNIFDVFIFPTVSASESLGLVAIEAMACGCPVIASDYAAPKYYIIDDENGYKFIKGNPEELASTIKKYLSLSEDEKMRLREGAISTGKQYSQKTITAKLSEIFG